MVLAFDEPTDATDMSPYGSVDELESLSSSSGPLVGAFLRSCSIGPVGRLSSKYSDGFLLSRISTWVFTTAMQLRGVVTMYFPNRSDKWVPSRSMRVGVLGGFS